MIALPTVILAFLFGQSRIFFVMARDGLLPAGLGEGVGAQRHSGPHHPRSRPCWSAIIAGLLPLDEIAALANAGTLAAFIAVALCMLVLRVRAPDAQRGFRTPAAWLVGIVAIGGCLYLFASLPVTTQLWFLAWNAIGLLVYLAYGSARRRSALG